MRVSSLEKNKRSLLNRARDVFRDAENIYQNTDLVFALVEFRCSHYGEFTDHNSIVSFHRSLKWGIIVKENGSSSLEWE